MRRRSQRNAGFTLIELMIVVAIISVLAATGIPAFANYQLRTKRAEAMANLSSLGKTQKAYFAEFGGYLWTLPEPSNSTGVNPTTTKRDETPIESAFAAVGWHPDGDVFYDYDTATLGHPSCGCAECFTASAYGDLDGDGVISVILYVHRDGAGNDCPSGVLGAGVPFERHDVTREIIDAPGVNWATDDF